MKDQEFQEWFDRFLRGSISRKEFIRRAILLGISLPTVASILAACAAPAGAPPSAKEEPQGVAEVTVPEADSERARVLTEVIYDEIFLSHQTTPGHPENSKRLEAILEGITTSGLKDKLLWARPSEADVEVIALVHSQEYIAKVASLSAAKKLVHLDPDTVVSEKTFQCARYAVGGVLQGLQDMANGRCENGFALVRPPGHHARKASGMGFCIFNNAAVGAEYAIREMGWKQVVIIDWDAHHGNGVQEIFYDRDDVLYISLHQYPHYPGTGYFTEVGEGRGEGFTINLPFGPGSGDSEYLLALEKIILPIATQFDPQLVLVCAGYDGHRDDPLSALELSTDVFNKMAGRVKDLAQICCEGRLLVVLEGGYGLDSLSDSVVATLRALVEPATDTLKKGKKEPSELPEASSSSEEMVEKLKDYFATYWKI
ncbi:MAG: Histone deacetylase-like amidohydrolase [Actinobacteria bacterium]|nr:Histone deacetylase-like amidohydrolase [Actinomycetota bacterium]